MSEQKRTKIAWVQLSLGMLAMMTISSPQYVWTLYVAGFQQKTVASIAMIQVTFSLLIIMQCWLAPIQGYFVERFGHRKLCVIGMVLVGSSWIAASHVSSVLGLYLTYGVMGGIGVGIVYISIISLMVKWFPDRKGFATGMAAAGYGFGAIATTFPISYALGEVGFDQALTSFGLGLMVCGVLISFGIRPPNEGEVSGQVPESLGGSRNFSSREMLKTPIFWTMCLMMTLMASGGLMVISQFALFAKDFGAGNAMVFGLSALPLALTIDRVANGVTRPFFGWISDQIGREQTMFIAFVLEAIAIAMLVGFGRNPLALVLLSGLVFFGWGEIFSLFPSTLTDTFGTKHAATNYGYLLIAQGLGSIIGGPLASVLREHTQSWSYVFGVVIVFDLVSAMFAIAVLAPMRRRFTKDNLGHEKSGLASSSVRQRDKVVLVSESHDGFHEKIGG